MTLNAHPNIEEVKEFIMSQMTPREIISELDRYIVGQANAKKAVSLALRNRWRRMQLEPEIRNEISPKNILMIGPTGVGKTEIARRLAKLANAPFIKVDATKFTEVGYVGKDVETIIRDLADASVKMLRKQAAERYENVASDAAEDKILEVLLRPARDADNPVQADDSSTRQIFRKKLRQGELDDKEIEIDIAQQPVGVEIMAPPGMEQMTDQLQGMFSNMGLGKRKTKKMKIKDAFRILKEEEAAKLVNEDELKQQAIDAVEQNGIVFLDEIDKVASRSNNSGSGEVSREGVQRDLLPLIEGTTVSTKYGTINTDHILFIASGAFHLAKPSDLIPELQGRLPIRVELSDLSEDDFKRILIEPKNALTKQYTALLSTEDLAIEFTDDAIERLAAIAVEVNEKTENIGARRLHTIIERLLEEISFNAGNLSSEHQNNAFVIDGKYVNDQLQALSQDEDLSRYIL